MASEQAKDLRKQGIAAAKAGQREQARKLFQQALRLEPNNEAAWGWMATVAKDERERLFCLFKLLEINSQSELGLSTLKQIGLTRDQLNEQVRQQMMAAKRGTIEQQAVQPPPESAAPPRREPPAAPSPGTGSLGQRGTGSLGRSGTGALGKPATGSLARTGTGSLLRKGTGALGGTAEPQAPPTPRNLATGPGVPMPDPAYINYIQLDIDPLVREYLAPPEGYPGITFVKKSKRRAGEGDIWKLRAAVAGGVLGVLAVIFVIGTVIVLNDPELRGIVFAPTWTPSPTAIPPTATFTPTPGNTPTPSVTPRQTLTPSPTVPRDVNDGSLRTPTPTSIYPPISGRAVEGAVGLIDARQYANALPTLVIEVTNAAAAFDPNPYYYQALALIRTGDLDGAQDVLDSAVQRLEDRPNESAEPLINAGRAYLNTLLAERSLAAGPSEEVATLLADAQDLAELAINRDPRLEIAYIALARRYTLDAEYTRALSALDDGLAVPQLAGSLNLIVEKARVYVAREDYERADYQTFLALYSDPFNEAALTLRTRIALAQDRPGLAVLRAQELLFYYPGSVEGYQLLGDARLAEGNLDLALAAYEQGSAGVDNLTALLARAEVLQQQRRFGQAEEALTQAYNLSDSPDVRALRLRAAVAAGSAATALEDIDALLGEGVVPDAELNLLKARLLIETAAEGEREPLNDALDLLEGVEDSLTGKQVAEAAQYRAQAQFALRRFAEALTAINEALGLEPTGSRYYLRGLIYEAQGNRPNARRDFEWVLGLGQLYPYPFLQDVRERLETLR